MGFSDVDCSDLAISTKMSIESIKGVVGSLTKKGLVNTENVTTHGRKIVRKRLVTYVVSTYQLVYLTDISYPLHPQYKKQVTSQLELIVE
jgi:hypothetical protein